METSFPTVMAAMTVSIDGQASEYSENGVHKQGIRIEVILRRYQVPFLTASFFLSLSGSRISLRHSATPPAVEKGVSTLRSLNRGDLRAFLVCREELGVAARKHFCGLASTGR